MSGEPYMEWPDPYCTGCLEDVDLHDGTSARCPGCGASFGCSRSGMWKFSEYTDDDGNALDGPIAEATS